MAEVFKAKAFGVEGFEKIIAIKRILPSMAEDADFIQMFIDEAKICGQLNHANICQIFELGRIEDSHFIAMEYIWGKDLLQIQNRFRRMRKTMPPAMAAYIGGRLSEGLDYAHRKKDATGRPLGIIHRDVSPQNILVSYEGEIKLIDFGIAKAASRSSKTQAGVLKGKFGYMSPEHVRSLPLDRRSDIFSIGTILYEILTNERLFLGESDFATLEKIRNVDVPPPSSVNIDVPEALDRIIMKALAKEVEERYQWASELQEDLQNFLAGNETVFAGKALSGWMREQFATEMRREAQVLEEQRRIGREAMNVLGQPRSVAPPSTKLRPPTMSGFSALSQGPPGPRSSPVLAAAAEGRRAAAEEPEDSAAGTITEGPSTLTPDDAGLGAVLVDVAGGIDVFDEQEDLDGKTAISTDMPGLSAAGRADLPNESTQILGGPPEAQAEAAAHEITASPTVVFSEPPALPPPPSSALMPVPGYPATPVPYYGAPHYGPGGTGAYALPPGSVPIQGQVMPSNTGMVMLPSGGYPSPLSGGYPAAPAPVSRPAASAANGPNALWKDVLVGVGVAVLVVLAFVVVKFLLSPSRGTIILTVLPPRAADVSLDDKLVGRVQPGGSLLIRDVPRGPHQLRVRADDGEAQQAVAVTSDEPPVQLTMQLNPRRSSEASAPAGQAPKAQQGSGVLKLRIQPRGALISIDGRLVDEHDLQKGSLLAANTSHDVRISMPGRRERNLRVRLNPGEEQEQQVDLEQAEGRLSVRTEPPGADLSIDSVPRGRTPLHLEALPVGRQVRVSIKKHGYVNYVKYLSFDGTVGYDQSLDVKLNAADKGGPKGAPPGTAAEPKGTPPPREPIVTSGDDGYLVANTKPWAKVFVDGKDMNKTTPIAPRDRIPLRPGKHTVTFLANQRKYNFDVVVHPGEVTKIIQELNAAE